MENLTPAEKPRADFFVTGDESIRDGLNLKFLPCFNLYNNDNRGGYPAQTTINLLVKVF